MVKFQLHFGRFGGVQNDPQKHLKTAFGAQGSLGDLQCTLWVVFGVHLVLILKLSGANVRALGDHFGFIFELCLQAPRPPALITPRTSFWIISSFSLAFPRHQAKLVTRSYVTTSPRSHHSTKNKGPAAWGRSPLDYNPRIF